MYLALYRKYRPRIFDDVISQDHITTTLKNQLKNGQSSHAYLFTGSRGTGKTTCARILAKALNCTNLKDGNPCLECDSCKSIDEDYSDIIEIDAASNNGVDNIRNLKEESFYAPLAAKYKVYIIDEVHMLSPNAFNALLKLIEEPPPHIVFIFATTEVHKVPATILSRCQRFEFRRIDINDSKKRLLWVAEQEEKKLTEDAAFLISKISEGGMRDALSLLDQCFAVSDDVDENIVRECAGISGSEYLFKIGDLINKQDSRELLITLDELISKSKDVTRLCEELISHYRSLMLIKSGADALTVSVTNADFDKLKAQSEIYSLEQIMRCLSILSETFTSMGRIRTPSLYLEMCFIKLCTPQLDIDEKSLSSRIDRLEQMISGGTVPKAVYYNSISENKEESPSSHEKQENSVTDSKPAKDHPDGSNAPFGSWQDILDSLPENISLGISNTKLYVSGSNAYIEGGKLALDLALNDYRPDIEKALSDSLGKKVTLSSYTEMTNPVVQSEDTPKINKLNNFLDLARSKGIKIKTQ